MINIAHHSILNFYLVSWLVKRKLVRVVKSIRKTNLKCAKAVVLEAR